VGLTEARLPVASSSGSASLELESQPLIRKCHSTVDPRLLYGAHVLFRGTYFSSAEFTGDFHVLPVLVLILRGIVVKVHECALAWRANGYDPLRATNTHKLCQSMIKG
jgi:hypothetical protein